MGCHNKHHRLGGLNNRYLFLTVLDAENSKVKVPYELVHGEDPLSDLYTDAFLLNLHMLERDNFLSHVSYKGSTRMT